MAGPSTFPDDENLQQAVDILTVQRDIEANLRRQKDLYKEIGTINKSVEDSIKRHSQEEARMLDTIRDKWTLYYREVQKGLVNKSYGESKQHQELLKNIEESIDEQKKLINLHRQMSSIEMESAKKIHDEDTKWFKFASSQLSDLFGLKVEELGLTKKIGQQIFENGVKSQLLANTIGAFLVMLKGSIELFKKMDNAAWEFRKAMGMTRAESAVIRKDAESLAIDYMAMGVTIDQVYKSYQAIGQAVGGVHNVTKSMARDVALMAAQLGISEETSAGFMRNLAAVSQSTMESQQNMMGLAQSISSAAGVNLGEVMQDVAKATGPTLTMMSRMPNTVLKTAIELRHMGTSLGDAAKSSRQLLNFTENVQDEMEASVLLGRSINLQRARELAYNRDLAGSTKEILRITKSVKFEQLDPFQQESFARATGKTVDELMKMLQTDKQIANVRRNGTAAQKAELAAYEKMSKENDAALKARGANAMYQIREMANQQRLAQIQNKWNELLAKAQQFLLPVIDKLLAGALALMDWAPAIMAAISPLAKGVAFLGEWLSSGTKIVGLFSTILSPLVRMGGIFGKIASVVLNVGVGISKFLGPIGKVIGFAGKFLGIFGKLLGPIGWVIMAFQAISGFIRGWNNTTGSWIQKLGGGLVGALEGVIPGFKYVEKFLDWIWDHAGGVIKFLFKWTTPIGLIITGFQKLKGLFSGVHVSIGGAFKSVWGFLQKIVSVEMSIWKFMFKWLTPVGLFIQALKGLKNIFPSIFNALTKPFMDAWNLIKSWWGGKSPSKIGLSIVQGLKSVGHLIYSALTAPFSMALGWLKKHIPGASLLFGKGNSDKAINKPVEKKAMATYVPAVTVSPTGTKLETSPSKPAKADDKGKSSATLDDVLVALETQNKLLEKLLAKDSNIKMDGQLLSTSLARQTAFKGGYGVNKV